MTTTVVQVPRCWIGVCAGCGRTLISATWGKGDGRTGGAELGYRNLRPVFCTRACRAANEDLVPRWFDTARKQRRREAQP